MLLHEANTDTSLNQQVQAYLFTTVLKRTIVIVLVIIIAFPRSSVWPDLVNCNFKMQLVKIKEMHNLRI